MTGRDLLKADKNVNNQSKKHQGEKLTDRCVSKRQESSIKKSNTKSHRYHRVEERTPVTT